MHWSRIVLTIKTTQAGPESVIMVFNTGPYLPGSFVASSHTGWESNKPLSFYGTLIWGQYSIGLKDFNITGTVIYAELQYCISEADQQHARNSRCWYIRVTMINIMLASFLSLSLNARSAFKNEQWTSFISIIQLKPQKNIMPLSWMCF